MTQSAACSDCNRWTTAGAESTLAITAHAMIARMTKGLAGVVLALASSAMLLGFSLFDESYTATLGLGLIVVGWVAFVAASVRLTLWVIGFDRAMRARQ